MVGIILCAGRSTRMGTGCVKILHNLAGKALYSWSLDIALELGLNPIILVLGHQHKLVQENLINNYKNRINTVIQRKQRGTGHAVSIALKNLNNFQGPILVLYGDTPLLRVETLKSLIELYKRSDSDIAMLTSHVSNPNGYGRIARTSSKLNIIEEFHATQKQKLIKEINSGIYLFNNNFLKKNIDRLEMNDSGEIYLTDLVNLTSKSIVSIEAPEDEILGVNDLVQLSNAERILRSRINNYWMLNGVRIIDPERTYIDFKVHISKGVLLEPGVVLVGNCKIFSGAVIKSYSVLQDAVIGKNSQIGPFANIRSRTVIGTDCKIGNFVEVKESYLAKKTKASHLSYIGNSSIGKFCNIGAGAITCNYNGFSKHSTKISDNVFVGSNTTLIAPLSIDNESYIAAGSVINKNVPQNTLAIGRAFQENKKIKTLI